MSSGFALIYCVGFALSTVLCYGVMYAAHVTDELFAQTPVPGKAPALLSTTVLRSRAMYPFMRF